MRVEPKKLVRRLGPAAMRALEAAVVEASRLGIPEVGPGLWMHALLESDASGASRLVDATGASRSALRRQLHEAAAANARPPIGRPIFASTLFQWIEDTWLFASVELGATRIDTAHLAWTWLGRRGRYHAGEPEALQGIDPAPLEAKLGELSDPDAAPSPTPAPASALAERLRAVEQRLAALDGVPERLAQTERRLAALEELASDAL